MFNKRLISMVPQALRYILRNVAAQWTALVANVVLMLLIGLFLQRLFDGVAVDGWVVMLLGAGVAVIAVRMACLTYAQRMGVAAAAAAKRSVRRQVYDKLVRMGPGYSERIATSEAVQVSVEGCEQLESYFGQYLPQLLYAVLAQQIFEHVHFAHSPFMIAGDVIGRGDGGEAVHQRWQGVVLAFLVDQVTGDDDQIGLGIFYHLKQ